MADLFFGRQKKSAARVRYGSCLLLDSKSIPVARGELTSPPDGINLQLRLTEGSPQEVVQKEVLQVVASNDAIPIQLGRVIMQRGNDIVLEPLRALGAEVRQNLRMPVSFESFIYPIDGGQVPIRANDLSCGGIAFFTSYALSEHERFEVVIPITNPDPVILWGEVIRQQAYSGSIKLYASKFVDLINDEEFIVREAVFGVQLSSAH